MRRRSLILMFILIAAPIIGWAVFHFANAPHLTLAGVVLDANSTPVVGANVRVPGRSDFAITDECGRFVLANVRETDSITAYKDGYLINAMPSTEASKIYLRQLPGADNASYEWVSPAPQIADTDALNRCGSCHAHIYEEWRSSGHSRSVMSRHFRDIYEGGKSGWNLLKEHSGGADVCASCHTPTMPPSWDYRNTNGFASPRVSRFTAPPGSDPAPAPTLTDVGAVGLQKSTSESQKRFVAIDPKVDLNGVHCDYCHKIVGPAEGQVGLTHGHFGLRLLRPGSDQLLLGPFTDANRSENAYSPFQKSSRLCASCHEGIVFGVRVYSTYSEWQESPAGKSGIQCQECHMKPTGKMTNMAPGHGGVERDPTTLSNHRFFDGSHDDMLKRCLQLKANATRSTDGIRVSVEMLATDIGHRVPTGFVDRNVVMSIEATDAAGKPLMHSQGSAILRTKTAGRLYAKQLKDFDGKSPVPFWRADPDLIDTRLKPDELDRSEWLFPRTTTTVRIRVVYRKFWPEVAAEKGWTDNETLIHEREIRVP